MNKYLAQSNKSRTDCEATKKRSNTSCKVDSSPAHPGNNDNRESELMEIEATPAVTAIANRHPADEIADIRDQIAVLKTRETKLRQTNSMRRGAPRSRLFA